MAIFSIWSKRSKFHDYRFIWIFVFSLIFIIGENATARGNPWDFDPGPDPQLQWSKLFSETPNYRGLAKEFLKQNPQENEKFNWPFGATFYRGRLKPNHVKVLIIGQDVDPAGVQDDSLANRAFSGKAGAYLQHFLNEMTVDHSYLFLNTLTYPFENIHALYDPRLTPSARQKLDWMTYHLNSPIVKHRHSIYNYALTLNAQTLSLVLAVGSNGQRAVQQWIKSLGGQCVDIDDCWLLSAHKKIRVLALPDPHHQDKTKIEKQFQAAWLKLNLWMQTEAQWLTSDQSTKSLTTAFQVQMSPLPHRDFAFGSMHRLGKNGATSNKIAQDPRNGKHRAIQVFSDEGCLHQSEKLNGICQSDSPSQIAPRLPLRFILPRENFSDMSLAFRTIPRGDHPWESPRHQHSLFDAGPPTEDLAQLLSGNKPGLTWPDFKTLGAVSHPSFGHGPIYRGRLDQARVIILADQMSHDDLFSGRALSGDAGQKLQSFLKSMGIQHSYAVIRTLPVDTLDMPAADQLSIAQHPQAVLVRNAILNEVKTLSQSQLLIAYGDVAKVLAGELIKMPDWDEIPIIYLDRPSQWRYNDNWQAGLDQIARLNIPADPLVSADYSYRMGDKEIIPRIDFPHQTPWWVGTSGDRAARAELNGQWSGDYYRIYVPNWVFEMDAPALSQTEVDEIKNWERDMPTLRSGSSPERSFRRSRARSPKRKKSHG